MFRIYHDYTKWEDYKNGFYNCCEKSKKDFYIKKVIEMFNNPVLTTTYMERVINEWYYSCEHNLTNDSMNRVAYIGQAACCIYASVPCDITMKAWKMLDHDIQNRSNIIASKIIRKWRLKKESEITSQDGRKKGTRMGYQMKLPFN